MYDYCKTVGITLFTVSHRKSLWKHHDVNICCKLFKINLQKYFYLILLSSICEWMVKEIMNLNLSTKARKNLDHNQKYTYLKSL